MQSRLVTGPEVPSTLPPGNCTATTGKDYVLTQVASIRIDAASRNEQDLQPVVYGVTPVLSATWDPSKGAITGAEMNCMKTVAGDRNMTTSPRTGGVPSQGDKVVTSRKVLVHTLGMLSVAVGFGLL